MGQALFICSCPGMEPSLEVHESLTAPVCIRFAWRAERFGCACLLFRHFMPVEWCFEGCSALSFAAPGCGSLWSYKRHKAILQMLHVLVCNNWSVLMYDAHALAHRKRVVCVWVSSQVYGVSMFIDAHLYSCRPQISVCQRVTHHITKLRRKC